ncbi:MAG: InlB B-repeat-containing protein, partial [Candidatus Scatosoma sp.]
TNYAKNLSSWSGTGATFTQIAGAVSVTLEEKLDGETVENGQAVTVLSKAVLFYADKLTVTVPEEAGRVLKSLKIAGADVTENLVSEGEKQVYVYKNTVNGNSFLLIQAEYLHGYNIKYELNGGFFSDGDEIPVLYTSENVGGNAVELPVPKRANHAFVGWYNRVEFSHSDAIMFDGLDYETLGEAGYNNGALTLYARWRDDYTAVFLDAATGECIESLSVKMGEAVAKESVDEILRRTGKTYGVYLDGECTKAADFPYTGRNNRLVFYVAYESVNFVVRFNTFSSGQIASRTVNYGDEIGALPVISKEGYTFGGWYLDDAFEEEISSATKIYSDKVFYAQWIKTAEPLKTTPLKTVTVITCCFAGLSLTALIAVWAVTKRKIK